MQACLSETTYNQLWPKRTLSPSEIKLCTYSQEAITVMGCCNVDIDYKGQTVKEMPIIVVKGNGPSLMGKNWLKQVTFWIGMKFIVC